MKTEFIYFVILNSLEIKTMNSKYTKKTFFNIWINYYAIIGNIHNKSKITKNILQLY